MWTLIVGALAMSAQMMQMPKRKQEEEVGMPAMMQMPEPMAEDFEMSMILQMPEPEQEEYDMPVMIQVMELEAPSPCMHHRMNALTSLLDGVLEQMVNTFFLDELTMLNPCAREMALTGCEDAACLKQRVEVLSELCALELLSANIGDESSIATVHIQVSLDQGEEEDEESHDGHHHGHHHDHRDGHGHDEDEDDDSMSTLSLLFWIFVVIYFSRVLCRPHAAAHKEAEASSLEPLEAASIHKVSPMAAAEAKNPKDYNML
ncbi:hypothetical protein T492DRAFT_994852 [Pavlovales sp. CCMP2436]|nr:hypothetical protein T492DRAFT_994852 [Pavlovales sp. CCMP2436]|mmetsp:Transcript_37454/g.86555  ORF Transcript_37454/g.86555 Transcript_37454/m.86555 type:complete len:261 (-) Transcript_37454:112-894(-)